MKIIPQCDKGQASFVFPLNQHESKQQDVQFHVCFVRIGNRPHHYPECTKLGSVFLNFDFIFIMRLTAVRP